MDKKKILSEELKRHMELLEYTFYMEEKPNVDDVDNLLLGAEKLYEQDPLPDSVTADTATTDIGMPINDPEDSENSEDVVSDPFDSEGGVEIEDEFPTNTDKNGTVEIDVTDIVDKSEQTRSEIEGMTSKMDELLGKLGELEGKVGDMDQVIDKIDNLEKEIAERNPTSVERLEMRSMDSFPYNVSLTDYWSDREGYETGNKDEEEYVITQKDVEEYSANDIKDSFDRRKRD